MQKVSGAPQYPITSVDNALRLLLRLRDEPVLRLSDVASGLGVANSTAHRLLAMLQHHAFVERTGDSPGYQIGPALAEIGLVAIRRRDVRAWARPVLEAAAADLDETIHLGVLESARVRYLDAIESSRAVRVAGRVGRVLPAHCTSIGKLLLAQLTDDEIASLLGPDPLPSETPASITSLADLLADLDQVRRCGYAVNSGESEDGVAAVAVPLRDHRGAVVAAISCAVPQARMGVEGMSDIANSLGAHSRQQSLDRWTSHVSSPPHTRA